MKKFTAKVDFSKLFYAMDFSVSTMFFTNGDLYISYGENWEYIIINECIFCKYIGSGNIEYVYDYFYTDREIRKLKLERINESRDKMLCIKTKLIDTGYYRRAEFIKGKYYNVGGISSIIYVHNVNYTGTFRPDNFYEYFASDSYIRKLKLERINESR